MDNKILWIQLHPPRTGGGNFISVLSEKFPKEEVFHTSIARYEPHSEKLDKDKVKFIVGHATYYGIHNLVPDREPRYFIFLRDPAERLVSDYNLKMGKEQNIIPFDEWYKNQIKNEMVHMLDLKFKGSASTRINVPKTFLPILRRLNYKTFYFIQKAIFNFLKFNKKTDLKKLENAKKLLDLCWFTGIVEKSNEDFKIIFDAMNLENVSWKASDDPHKKVLILDDKLREKIYQDNPLDYELYQYALKLNEKKKQELKGI